MEDMIIEEVAALKKKLEDDVGHPINIRNKYCFIANALSVSPKRATYII